MADDISKLQEFGFDVREMEGCVLARNGPVYGHRIDFDGSNKGGLGAGHDEDGFAGLHTSGFYASGYGEGVRDTATEYVVDGQAEWFCDSAGDWFGDVEKREERWTLIP